jgi:hypothetical protein
MLDPEGAAPPGSGTPAASATVVCPLDEASILSVKSLVHPNLEEKTREKKKKKAKKKTKVEV